jgi:hypothetical protein
VNQSNSPFGPAKKPSTETLLSIIIFLIFFLLNYYSLANCELGDDFLTCHAASITLIMSIFISQSQTWTAPSINGILSQMTAPAI